MIHITPEVNIKECEYFSKIPGEMTEKCFHYVFTATILKIISIKIYLNISTNPCL